MADSSSKNSQRVSKFATTSLLIAFSILLVCILAAVFFLPLMGFLGIAMVVGGAIFSVLVGAHYLLWGWWIHRILKDDPAQRDQEG